MPPMRTLLLVLAALVALAGAGCGGPEALPAARAPAMVLFPMKVDRGLELTAAGALVAGHRVEARFAPDGFLDANGEYSVVTIHRDGSVTSRLAPGRTLGKFDAHDAFVWSATESDPALVMSVDDEGVAHGGRMEGVRFRPFEPRARRTAVTMLIFYVLGLAALARG